MVGNIGGRYFWQIRLFTFFQRLADVNLAEPQFGKWGVILCVHACVCVCSVCTTLSKAVSFSTQDTV